MFKKVIFISFFLVQTFFLFADNKDINTYVVNLMHFFETKNMSIIDDTITIYSTDEDKIPDKLDSIVVMFYIGIKNNQNDLYASFNEKVSTTESKRLKIILQNVEQFNLKDYLVEQEPTPNKIDNLWTLYFSSGNTEYIDNMLTIVQKYYYEINNLQFFMSARSAIWSIKLNIKTYPLVLKYFNDQNIIDKEISKYINDNDSQTIRNDTINFIKIQKDNGIWR